MTTLVTGGNGWVPSHVVKRLAERGARVVSYDLSNPDEPLMDLLGDVAGEVVFERGDVVDRGALRAAAEKHGVTNIIHAAVITPRIGRERSEPDTIVAVNLTGTVNALEVARELAGFRRFVYVSSCAVWGDVPEATELTEETPSYATSLYGITKYASERIALRYHTLFGLDVVAVRPANVYGPMERISPGFVGATEIREMLRLHYEGQTIKVNSLKGPYLDWTYVGDIADGIERVWAADALPHRVYSLTAGRLYSIGDVLKAFAKHLPDLRYEQVTHDEANYHVSGDAPGPVPSNARMREDFGWAPETALVDGMGRYLDWVARYGPQ
jgi:UDP-glucose 4-epimerase